MVATITAFAPSLTVGLSMLTANALSEFAARGTATAVATPAAPATRHALEMAIRRAIMIMRWGAPASRWPLWPPAHREPFTTLLPDREHPDDPTLWHVLLPAEKIAEQTLLEGRIDAPAGGDADVLDAVHGERDGRSGDAGVRAELPQHFSGARVEGAEEPVARAAAEDEPPGGRQHRPPVHGVGEQVAPHALVAADVPRLDLAEVPRGLVDGEADVRDVDARPPLTRHVGLNLALHVAAVVVVGRDEEHAALRVVGREQPILTSPKRQTKV